MSYSIRYTQPARRDRFQTAAYDAVAFLGETRYAQVIERLGALRPKRLNRQHVNSAYLALSMLGLRGVPATAIIRQAWNLWPTR